jgi:thioredoxin 1
MSAVLEITDKEFESKAIQAEGLVVVDFSAKWCGPCQRMYPELVAAAEELAGQVTVVKVDVDESPETAMRYGVQGIPNLTLLRDGKVVDVAVGAMPKSAITALIRRNLGVAAKAQA